MALQYVKLPLFEDQDYEYQVSLQGNSYIFRAYYNTRQELWFWELKTEAGIYVIRGEALVPNYPIGIDYILPNLTGYLWMEPSQTLNTEKYKQYPELIAQYYNLYYIYDTEE